MKLKFTVLGKSEYKELYFLLLLQRLKEGFFQKNGFVVLPEVKMKESSEVVFPKVPEKLFNEACDFLEHNSGDYYYSFTLDLKAYKKLRTFSQKVFGDNFINTEKLIKFLSTNTTKLATFIDFLIPDQTSICELKIIPVNFGTSGTVAVCQKSKKLILYITYRIDLPIEYFVHNLILAIVCSQSLEIAGTERDSSYWQKRQYLVDYLFTNTKLIKLFPNIKKTKGTLRSLKELEQFGLLMQESKAYLTKLGLNYSREVRLVTNTLEVGDIKVYLSDSEKRIFEALLENRGKVVYLDAFASKLWNDEGKFSLQAISKIISNIRIKLRTAGVMNELIYTSRGKGFFVF